MSPSEKYALRLYVTGMTPRSTRAIEHVRAVCEEHLAGSYDLEIIDVYQTPARIMQDQVVAIPTLIKARPLPVRLLVGDMSNRQRLLHGLGLPSDDQR
ncbi:MAG TPA: circadian clock KaiB family protein [Steroidobacteraceae bacterium]|nr:circadian clock KaiB family protein [Steroidobacteraceae bacterium]